MPATVARATASYSCHNMSQFFLFFKVFCIALVATQKCLTTADRATPEHGDALFVLIEDFYGVQAGTPAAVFFQRNCSQFIATTGRPQKFNASGCSYRYVIVGIAGEGKCRIGKRKNEATVTDVESIEHIVTDAH